VGEKKYPQLKPEQS